MVKTDETNKILSELEQFTGTENYYQSTYGRIKLTDGMQYLRERLNCYWLIDLVESYQPKVKDIPFQIWSIDKNPDSSAVVEMKEDSGLEPIIRQEIPYTDFKLKNYEFYCVDGVVLLKSEY